MTLRVQLELAGEERAVLRALRLLLKRLLRDHGVVCRSITPAAEEKQP